MVEFFTEDDGILLFWADQPNNPDEWTSYEMISSPTQTSTQSSSSSENDDVQMVLEPDTSTQEVYITVSDWSYHAMSVDISEDDDNPTPWYFETQPSNVDSYYDMDDQFVPTSVDPRPDTMVSLIIYHTTPVIPYHKTFSKTSSQLTTPFLKIIRPRWTEIIKLTFPVIAWYGCHP